MIQIRIFATMAPASSAFVFVLLAAAFSSSSAAAAFVAPPRRPLAHRPSVSATLRSSPEQPPEDLQEVFSSAGWKPTKADLDTCPLFTVANGEGQPLQYSVGSSSLPFFFVDVDDAKEELAKAKSDPELSGMELMDRMDIIPFPLGAAFEMWARDEAAVVPSKASIQAAGAPPDANPMGQAVPLFACLSITQEDEKTGRPALPLFFDRGDAEDAVREATELDGGDADDMPIEVLSLEGAVRMLTGTVKGDNPEVGFRFLPSNKSVRHIQEYLGG